MKEKQLKRMIAQWIIPFLLLLILVIALVVKFSVQSKQAGKRGVEESLGMTAQNYAVQFKCELGKMTYGGLPIASYLLHYNKEGARDAAGVINELLENTNAYQVIICNAKGAGLQPGSSNQKIDISNTDYFEKMLQIQEPAYFYTEDDGFTGEKAIVSAIPLGEDKAVNGYILLFYKSSAFEDLIKRAEFDGNAFYAVVDEEGTVICSAGKTNSDLFAQQDFYQNILQKGNNDKAVDNIRKWMMNQMSGIQYVSSDKESRGIVFAPTGINHWYMFMGVNESYINQLESKAWKNARSMLIQLLVVIAVFGGAVVTVNIVSKVHNTEKSKALEDKADTDLLTELNNKIATERKIKEYLFEHPDEQAMMFVLDIDNFKKINDTKGHVFGDEVLRTLGMRIKAEFRVSDVIGRTGGDEFTIFLKNIKDDHLIEREGKRVERFFQNFQAGDYVKYSVTASIGAAIYPRDGSDFEELYKAADHALYIAKRRGKNQLAFYGSEKENR